ncbi:hypothetical protein CRUP_006296 [Coryphaenoides rupestris]|nr:hypothetical protein CRUP_006296 [Coryphaenoides rupestris]
MNGIILRIFAAGLVVAVGHALQCYKCDIGIFSLCATSKEVCATGEQCYSGVGTAAGFVEVKMKGCLPVADCNKTMDTNLPGTLSNTTVYSMTKTCCNMDLCNAAPPAGSRLALLPLGLASLTSLLLTSALL